MASSRKDIEDIYVPALPIPTQQYDFQRTTQTNNILRLFFNKLVGTIKAITDVDDGGKYLYFPRGLFYDTTTQTAAATNTPYPLTYGITYIGNGVSITNNSEIRVPHAGYYNFQVSAQLASTNASSKLVHFWIRKSGVDVAYGAHEYTISGGGTQMVVQWNFIIDMLADDYIEIMWSTDGTNVEIHSHAPDAVQPGVPSVVAAVSFVSNS